MDTLAPLPFQSSIEQYIEQTAGPDHAEVARFYGFRNWQELEEFVSAVPDSDSPVWRFESAAEAVISGDTTALQELLDADPTLIHRRSMRSHHATLLHYVAANGVEQYRQKSPKNAPGVARLLLGAGSIPDATADMYGSPQTTLNMLVSSQPPALAEVQVPLVDVLLEFGADIELGCPLFTALAHGYPQAAENLVRRGAHVDDLPKAAGLGLLAETQRMLPPATAEQRHQALALAAQHGRLDVVRLLLDAGEDPSRYNPHGNHDHSTPLHQAALAGHEQVVRLLVERGARVDLEDKIYHGTPRGWAIHAGQSGIEQYLSRHAT